MNKKILALSTTLLLGLALASCNKPSSSSVSSSNSSETTSSSVEESSSTESSITVTDTMPTLAKALNDGARTREYQSEFDLMVNDFSGDTLAGEMSGDAYQNKQNYLEVSLEATNEETFPSSPDKSIYKQAPKSGDVHNNDGIGFKMKVSKGSVKLSDLVLGLRGSDALAIYEISLADALDNDGEGLPELSDEFTDIVISPSLSIDDANTVYKNTDGSDSTTKVLDTIVGFHLYARGDVHAMIEISEVYALKGQTKTVYDDFARKDVNFAGENAYWRDSTGFIVSKSVMGQKEGSYQIKAEGLADYQNVVLSLIADSNDISLVPVYASGDGTAFSWASLKDDTDTAVVSLVNGCYGNYVINLEKSGISAEGLLGFKVTYKTSMSLNMVFMTNMEEKEAAKSFPVIDSANAVIFDDFSRVQNKVADNYDAGNSTADTSIGDAGLNHVISYHNNSMVKVNDGNLIFDATNLAADDYINFVESSKTGRTTQQYMVLSMKLEDGATYDNFRFQFGTTVVYYNDFYAAQGLKSNNELNPYVKDGYTWCVIDLELTGMTGTDEITMYYSGKGKLLIDTIFFADIPTEKTALTGEAPKIMDAKDNSHQWLSAGKNNGGTKLEVLVKGNGENDLASFRIEGADGNEAIFANNQMVMKVNGVKIDSSYVLPTEEVALIIDLEASGWTNFNSDITLVLGDWAPGYMDVSAVNSIKVKTDGSWTDAGFAGASLAPTTDNPHTFSYLGYNATGAKKMRLTMKGDGVHDLASFRIEVTDANNVVTAYFANATLKMYVDGQPITSETILPATDTVVEIDLVESGVTALVANYMAIYGDWGEYGTIELKKLEFFVEPTATDIMSSLPERVVE